MKKLNNEITKLVSELNKIPLICEEFKKYPTNENGEGIIKIIENSERFLLKVKENIVIIVNEVKEENVEVKGLPSDNGFLINKGI